MNGRRRPHRARHPSLHTPTTGCTTKPEIGPAVARMIAFTDCSSFSSFLNSGDPSEN